ncbi:MAG: SDR family oxidoreductase [Bacteroidota bacterium]|jgi:3-oxoacyl-[acyl-carrier protein] reductase
MDLQVKGKVFLVSGASKGLGFSVARNLAADGALLAISSSNTASIQSAAGEITNMYGSIADPSAVDVRSPKEIEHWIESAAEKFGRIDGIFINSGGPPAGEFVSLNDADWQHAFELLVLSSIRLSRAAVPHLKKTAGAILFNTSLSVKEPVANLTLSNVLRGSVSSLSKTLSKELAPFRIRVNQILPGRIDTDRIKSLDAVNAEKQHLSAGEMKQKNIVSIPLGRYGDPDEFGRVAAFLLSPAASYITGESISVDGGFMKSVL